MRSDGLGRSERAEERQAPVPAALEAAIRDYLAHDGSGIKRTDEWAGDYDAIELADARGRLRAILAEPSDTGKKLLAVECRFAGADCLACAAARALLADHAAALEGSATLPSDPRDTQEGYAHGRLNGFPDSISPEATLPSDRELRQKVIAVAGVEPPIFDVEKRIQPAATLPSDRGRTE